MPAEVGHTISDSMASVDKIVNFVVDLKSEDDFLNKINHLYHNVIMS